MSKAAVGQNRIQMGTATYFRNLNENAGLYSCLVGLNEYNYNQALQNQARRIHATITTIDSDLKNHVGIIRYIPSSNRSQLSNLVQRLEAVCSLASSDSGNAMGCRLILDQRGMSAMTRSMATESALSSAADLMERGGESGLDKYTRVATVKEAMRYNESFAVGNDEKKRIFLSELTKNQSNGFLADLWDYYNYRQNPGDYCGQNGHALCSEAYVTAIERQAFPNNTSSVRFQTDYAGLIGKGFISVISQMTQDVHNAQRERDYLTDECGERMQLATADLDSCGIRSGSLVNQILKLCWYTAVDPRKVIALQQALNQLGFSLKEDGVYGIETSNAWFEFLNKLEHGVVPVLNWIDPLKTSTGTMLEIGNSALGLNPGISNVIQDANLMVPIRPGSNAMENLQYFRIDAPHQRSNGTYQWANYRGTPTRMDYNHINLNFGDDATALQQWLQQQYNHYPLSDDAYKVLSNLEETGKVVRKAGRVLLVAGIALDALEMGTAIYNDLNDADRKLGKTTVATAASIGGRWAGAAGGAKLGAMGGMAMGPLAPIAVPVLAVIGGIGGSFVGDAFARWVVDITYIER